MNNLNHVYLLQEIFYGTCHSNYKMVFILESFILKIFNYLIASFMNKRKIPSVVIATINRKISTNENVKLHNENVNVT